MFRPCDNLSGPDMEQMGIQDPVVSPSTEHRFLPDFCSARAVLAVVLLAELVAIVLTLARYEDGTQFWQSLSRVSLFLLWCTLLSAGLLCATRKLFGGRGPFIASLAASSIVLASVAATSVGAWWMGRAWRDLPALIDSGGAGELPAFLATNLVIAAIVSGLLFRYFWVTAQWRQKVQEEARARIRALQARIRPHFLFNSMNTIAALTRTDPDRAEEAVEDLSDLFRASLSDSASTVTIKEELEISRTYQRIEQHRLGNRLAVEWLVTPLPLRARIPALSVQPLLENAVYHGIERLAKGGTIVVKGSYDDAADMIEIRVENPLPEAAEAPVTGREGNRMALDNLRQRFALTWGGRASVESSTSEDFYTVLLRFPAEIQA